MVCFFKQVVWGLMLLVWLILSLGSSFGFVIQDFFSCFLLDQLVLFALTPLILVCWCSIFSQWRFFSCFDIFLTSHFILVTRRPCFYMFLYFVLEGFQGFSVFSIMEMADLILFQTQGSNDVLLLFASLILRDFELWDVSFHAFYVIYFLFCGLISVLLDRVLLFCVVLQQ